MFDVNFLWYGVSGVLSGNGTLYTVLPFYYAAKAVAAAAFTNSIALPLSPT